MKTIIQHRAFVIILVGLVALCLAQPQLTSAQQLTATIKKSPQHRLVISKDTASDVIVRDPSEIYRSGGDPEMDPPSPEPPDTLDFQLDWVNCQMHRVDDTSPIQVTLTGNIYSTIGNHWTLSMINPQLGGPPNLYFVEDILGRAGSTFGSDIALTWEISVDGGPYSAMTLEMDNTLSTYFTPGNHNFSLRITGMPDFDQSDGYYQLQLSQFLTPGF